MASSFGDALQAHLREAEESHSEVRTLLTQRGLVIGFPSENNPAVLKSPQVQSKAK